ncbi:ATP/GTP-binding protein [Vibrio sp. 10N.286.49.E1]|uniref:Chromosome segregation protein SMC n=1 Tax=Vibrio tasmaniensis 1F-267 TaxID=1191324 RepID=A0ABX3BAE8_9VIBR|nr:ATP-binding protein [Vibrio tasmaniensis]OEF51880.1 chromosome segregation protein SMC [Vibrio tasmaniensis 1F-267]
MLKKLAVKNFRNFSDWFELDLKTDRAFEFNTHVVVDNTIKHSMIYGKNGQGKSNVGLALLDITCHLTDPTIMDSLRSNYISALTSLPLAEFVYEFSIDGVDVVYKYGKEACDAAIYEELFIDGRKVIDIDRRKSNIAKYDFDGDDSLKDDFTERKVSAVRYVNSNALLDKSTINDTFFKFMEFVEGMIFFRTLSRMKDYHGQPVDSKRISQTIIEQDKLEDFEKFLNESGVECKLQKSGPPGQEFIEFVFDGRNIQFSLVASTGTLSLGIFYFWYLKLLSGKIFFAYIDEFDAYYHFSLSKRVVDLISKLDCQSIITTHNISLMSNNVLRPDCYFELKNQQLVPLHKLSNREIRKGHNLEKMYRSGAFDE